MTSIIGFCGWMGTGKTTIAYELKKYIEHHFPTFQPCIVSFAKAVKDEVCALYGCHSSIQDKMSRVLLSEKHKEKGLIPGNGEVGFYTIREILQWYGTDIRRKQDPDYWVKRTREQIVMTTVAKDKSHIVIIDDVRFPNEAEFIREQEGQIVRMLPYLGYVQAQGVSDHISENALPLDIHDFSVRPAFGKIPNLVPQFGFLFRSGSFRLLAPSRAAQDCGGSNWQQKQNLT